MPHTRREPALVAPAEVPRGKTGDRHSKPVDEVTNSKLVTLEARIESLSPLPDDPDGLENRARCLRARTVK